MLHVERADGVRRCVGLHALWHLEAPIPQLAQPASGPLRLVIGVQGVGMTEGRVVGGGLILVGGNGCAELAKARSSS